MITGVKFAETIAFRHVFWSILGQRTYFAWSDHKSAHLATAAMQLSKLIAAWLHPQLEVAHLLRTFCLHSKEGHGYCHSSCKRQNCHWSEVLKTCLVESICCKQNSQLWQNRRTCSLAQKSNMFVRSANTCQWSGNLASTSWTQTTTVLWDRDSSRWDSLAFSNHPTSVPLVAQLQYLLSDQFRGPF